MFACEDCLAEIGQPPSHETSSTADNGGNKYKQIMRLRDVHLLALFILVYVGTEVTLGGWIVTYVQRLRGGGPSAGYISSGFFGGTCSASETKFCMGSDLSPYRPSFRTDVGPSRAAMGQ